MGSDLQILSTCDTVPIPKALFHLLLHLLNFLLGRFAGQNGYGALSIFAYVDAAIQVNAGTPASELDDGQLATMTTTVTLTAVSSFPFILLFILGFDLPYILEAGKISMDNGGKPVVVKYESDTSAIPIDIVLA